jgi:hypothetical protein
MMKQETTMTIKREIFVASDVSDNNDILFLDKTLLCCTLSAAAMISSFDSILSAQITALDFIHDMVKQTLPEYEAWLLIGHAIWQQDTKITRHKKLWSTFTHREIPIPKGERLGEKIIESAQGIKFFDAVRCEKFNANEVISLLREIRAGALIYVRNDKANELVSKLIMDGWERDNPFAPSKILNTACTSDFLVCCLLGEFDDVESGCAILGQKKIIQQSFGDTKTLGIKGSVSN